MGCCWRWLFLFGSLFQLVQAQSLTEGFQKTPGGLWYKIVVDSGKVKARKSDFLMLHMVYATHRDSILFSTHESETGPMKFNVTDPTSPADLMEVFSFLGEGDSAIVLIPTDVAFKNQKVYPPFARPGEFIKVYIHVLSHSTREEHDRMQAEEARQRLALETEIIEEYLRKKQLVALRTASGLYYMIDDIGSGAQALPGKRVTVHYTGRLLDGREFDSSRNAGRQPFTFKLGAGQVIRGWDEGIALFNAGGKGTLIIPSVLGYGPRAAGTIPPNSILIFDIEILEVE